MLKKSQFRLFCLCLFVAFVSVNVAITLLTRPLMADMSNNKKFSISEETKNWLKNNKKNVYLRLFVSQDWKNYNILKNYAVDVVRLLEKYQLESGNKLSIKIIEVAPLSDKAAEADKFGIAGKETEVWFGLVATNEDGNFGTIPFLNPLREDYLEYDITKLLKRLDQKQKPIVGVMSSEVSVKAPDDIFSTQPDWPVIEALKDDFEFKFVNNDIAIISDDIDVLMIVNPKSITNLTNYAIDQYLIRGGNLLVFVDPISEIALMNDNLMIAPNGLEKILKKAGITIDRNFVAADMMYNRYINSKNKNKEKYPFWINVYSQNNHQVVDGINNVLLNTAGFIELEPKEKINQYNLLMTSNSSGIAFIEDVLGTSLNMVSKNIKETDMRLPVAVLAEGIFVSAYQKPYLMTKDYISGKYAFRSISINPSKLIVVSDSDMLNSKLWNANDEKYQEVYNFIPYSGNLMFVERALRYLSNKDVMLPPVKQDKINVWTLDAALYNLAERIYQNKSLKINNDLAEVKAKQTEINQMVKEQGNIPSVKVVRDIEDLQRKQ